MKTFKEEIFWIVIDPQGWIGCWKIACTRKQAIEKFLEEYTGYSYGKIIGKTTWRTYRRQGFRAFKIKIVPEDAPFNLYVCPDCGELLVKSWIECHDGSGWICAWICKCEKAAGDEK